MSLLEIVILAIVQGLTEFLPVSSSGHLVVANALLETTGRPPVADLLEVNIVLHVGTLLAVVVVYWRELARLVSADRRVVPLLVVGTIPAAAIGVPLKAFGEWIVESPLLAGLMFPVTAAILYWGSRRAAGDGTYADMSYRAALGIGAMQALALLPGVSRSGSTIVGGIVAGLDRTSAATFAFLLAVPAIGGAGAIETLKLLRAPSEAGATPTATLAAGAAVSFIVGWLALRQLLRFVRTGRLTVFCWYLLPLGVAVTVWQLGRLGAGSQ